MAHRTTITGALVGAVERAYNGFTDRDGNAQPGGITRLIYLSASMAEQPEEIRFRQADAPAWKEIAGLAFGTQLAVRCDLVSRNNRVSASYVEHDVADELFDSVAS
jgi:hypothetical protein